MHGQGEIQNYGDQIFDFELANELNSIYLVGYGEGGFDYHNLGKFGDGSGFSGRSYFSFDDKQ